MRRSGALLVSALVLPELALAQEIPASFAWLALGAPLLTLIVTIIAGFVTRSWLVALSGLGLLAFWAAFYLFAAEYLTNDVFFWIPIVGMHLQLIAVVLWLFWRKFMTSTGGVK